MIPQNELLVTAEQITPLTEQEIINLAELNELLLTKVNDKNIKEAKKILAQANKTFDKVDSVRKTKVKDFTAEWKLKVTPFSTAIDTVKKEIKDIEDLEKQAKFQVVAKKAEALGIAPEDIPKNVTNKTATEEEVNETLAKVLVDKEQQKSMLELHKKEIHLNISAIDLIKVTTLLQKLDVEFQIKEPKEKEMNLPF